MLSHYKLCSVLTYDCAQIGISHARLNVVASHPHDALIYNKANVTHEVPYEYPKYVL